MMMMINRQLMMSCNSIQLIADFELRSYSISMVQHLLAATETARATITSGVKRLCV